MNLRREIGLGLGSIVVLQLLSVLLALTLLARMAPAIEQIRRENVTSSQAVEAMLASLVRVAEQRSAGDADLDDVVLAREVAAFDLALLRAEDNITEQGERPALAIIRAQRQQAFAGDRQAWETLVEQLRRLGDINRASMASADLSAQRLGQAGAWAAALLGALALGLAILIYRRVLMRVALPLDEISDVTQDVRRGNLHRRCLPDEGPAEVALIAANLNWMLEQLAEARSTRAPEELRANEALRQALLGVLDLMPGPAAITDEHGERVAANVAWLNQPPTQEGLVAHPLRETALQLWTVPTGPG